MKAEIVHRAHELGFDACRVDRAAPPAHAAEFRRWLAEGRHGTMSYMERTADKRTDSQIHGNSSPCERLARPPTAAARRQVSKT